jgi:hypothetical protein
MLATVQFSCVYVAGRAEAELAFNILLDFMGLELGI